MKVIWAKICLMIIGIILALISGEIFIAKFYPQPVFSELYPYDFHCFTQGSYYWLKLKPNSSCLLKTNLGSFKNISFKTNNLGLRNPEIEKKDENTLRVLFLGDSYTIGWGVEENEAFPRITETKLQKLIPERKIETINAGLTGTGTDYAYLFYKNEESDLKPDIVVTEFFFYNDVPEDLFSAKWEEDENGLPKKSESTFFYVDSNGMFYPKIIPLKYKIPFLRQSHLFVLLMNQFPNSSLNPTFNSRFLDPHICLYKKACHDIDVSKEKAKKLFSALKDMTEKNNQKLLVVFIPVEFQIDKKTVVNYPGPILPSDLDYPYEYFSDFFDSYGIDYLDLRDYFKELPREDIYLFRDDHFNPSGHRITAEAISKKLLEIMNLDPE